MGCALVEDEGKGEEFYAATSWMLCSQNTKLFDDPIFDTRDDTGAKETTRPVDDPKIRPWTDDYSNLFKILKKRGE